MFCRPCLYFMFDSSPMMIHQNVNFLFRLCQPGHNFSKFVEYLVPAL
jgi:hypothetical protein